MRADSSYIHVINRGLTFLPDQDFGCLRSIVSFAGHVSYEHLYHPKWSLLLSVHSDQ